MIDLYTAATPNGQKIHIMLEECGLNYATHWIDIDRGEQFAPDFLKISPNNKIPALVDHDGPSGDISLFESGAILLYLADKTKKFLPAEPGQKWETIQWLMWQMGGFGPMLGQAHHFNKYAPENPQGPVVLPYAQDRYTNEAKRLYGVLDRRLTTHEWVAAEEYTIADMAIFPWCRLYERQRQNIDDFPNVKRWFAVVAARPAVAKDMDRLEDIIGEWTRKAGRYPSVTDSIRNIRVPQFSTSYGLCKGCLLCPNLTPLPPSLIWDEYGFLRTSSCARCSIARSQISTGCPTCLMTQILQLPWANDFARISSNRCTGLLVM